MIGADGSDDHVPAGADAAYPGWSSLAANLAADAVLFDAQLYAAGCRRLTVEHGEPLTEQAIALLVQLIADVDHAALRTDASSCTRLIRPTSVTWTFTGSDQVPAQSVVLAARRAADSRNPGGWVITADDYP